MKRIELIWSVKANMVKVVPRIFIISPKRESMAFLCFMLCFKTFETVLSQYGGEEVCLCEILNLSKVSAASSLIPLKQCNP